MTTLEEPVKAISKVAPILGLIVLTASASAGTLTINDLADTVTLTPSGLFGVLSGTNCNGETCSFSLNAPAGAAQIVMNFDFGSVLMTETAGGPLSDWLNCADCGQGASFSFWQFASDTEGVLLPPPATLFTPTRNLVENG